MGKKGEKKKTSPHEIPPLLTACSTEGFSQWLKQ